MQGTNRKIDHDPRERRDFRALRSLIIYHAASYDSEPHNRERISYRQQDTRRTRSAATNDHDR